MSDEQSQGLERIVADLKAVVEAHVTADLEALTALNKTMAENTAITQQVKDILEGFKTFGAIVKFVLKWVTLIGGTIATVLALKK